MKRSNSLTEDQFLKDPGHSFGIKMNLEDQQPLVFVTEVRDVQIKFSNLSVNRFFDLKTLRKKQNNFYEDVVHPDDYEDLLYHLRSLQNELAGKEIETVTRLRNKSRTWKKFIFRHRLYEGSEEQVPYVISIAKQKTSSGKGKRSIGSQPVLEKALLKSHHKYHLLMESIEEAFCVIDVLFDTSGNPVDYLLLETNSAFRQHAPINSGKKQTIKEVVANTKDHCLKACGTVASTRKPIRFQEEIEDRDARFDFHVFPFGEDTNLVGILCSEVQEEKLSEQKLKRANETLEEKVRERTAELETSTKLLQTVFDTTREGIMILKPVYDEIGTIRDFNYLRVNKVIKEQYQNDHLEGNSFTAMNPRPESEKIFEALKRTMSTGETEDFEIRDALNDKDSWYRVTTRRDDKVLIATLEDITRNKFSSRRLRENVRFKKQLIKTSPDIIIIFNLYEENIQFVNRDLAPIEGMERKNLIGMPITGIIPLIHPHDREKSVDFHQKLTRATDRDILDVEFRLKTEENQWEWFNARGKVFMRSKQGKVCEYIVLLRNIEQQKRTQQALLHAEKLSIKGEVARTLAHELRNPMASIGMAADILSKKTAGEQYDQLPNYIGIIKRSTEILNRLVTDLLSSSKYSPLKPRKCCLAETLNEAIKAASDRIYLVGIKVVKNYSGHYYILADPEKLKIALLNIIVNASEAMDPDKGVLKLSITRRKNEFRLNIEDNGCGMEKDQLEKLFDAFYTQKPHGVGIGLSSVKNILDEHDARVLVESKPNVGTTFLLTFHSSESFERSSASYQTKG